MLMKKGRVFDKWLKSLKNADNEPLSTTGTEMESSENENQPIEEASQATSDDELHKLKAEIEELKDKHLRSLAEFENYKKRVIKERSELIKYQGESIVKDILDVVDDFERAIKFADADPATLKDGVQMIYKAFIDVLGRHEVRGESSIGKTFDPVKHAAISKVPAPDKEADEVIDELKKPYFYKDKLIRVGEVVIAAPKEEG